MMYQLAVTSYFLIITLLVIIILSPLALYQQGSPGSARLRHVLEFNNCLEDSLYLQVT